MSTREPAGPVFSGRDVPRGRLELSRRTLLKAAAAAELSAWLPHASFGQGPVSRAGWKEKVAAYLEGLARPDGGHAWSDQATSHLTPTFAVIGSYRLLGEAPPRRETLAEFVRTHHPFQIKKLERDLRGFEYQQIQSLLWLGESADRAGCVRFLGSLANADGGFGDRPGWASNPLATYYALGAFEALGTDPKPARAVPRPRTPIPSDLKVYTIQIEAHGKGSPADAVELARALRIQIWGAKNARPAWIARAQEIARQRQVPVTFAVANEEYGTWVDVPGMGTYSHTSDVMAPAGHDAGPSLANQGVVSWPDYRSRRLAALERAGGRLIWQFGENEELTRIFLDDSLERGGFAAISTFHFGNPDFTNSEPFLHPYRGRLPFVALQDAHGDEPWWFADMTAGFRTLFLAREATWEGWLEALRHNRVLAVRHDAVSGFRTWIHGGSDEVVAFVQERGREWRWWDNPDIVRPLVSLVALSPADEFEAARPEQGLVLRVRCAWENTTQGMPKKPLAELARLIVDGSEVSPRLVTKKRPTGTGLSDHYHVWAIAEPAPGRHHARAVVRRIETGVESTQELEFHA